MKRITFVQISSKWLNEPYKDTIANQFYEGMYKFKANDGYWKSEHFWEIPTWIAEIDGYLVGQDFETELYIIRNEHDIWALSDHQTDYILFSVLDANKHIYERLIYVYKGIAELIAGGYCEFYHSRIKWFNTTTDFANYLGIKYVYRKSFRLFTGEKTIPRLTLSTGCMHKCKFCTITHTITELGERAILSQIEAFTSLRYKLIYISDATFGQAGNYEYLQRLYTIIKRLNPIFDGFIIQTTAFQLSAPGFIESLYDLHIKVVEIGMETYNNHILKSLHKPATEKLIDYAVCKLYNHEINIILNVIIGLPAETKETYRRTLNYLKLNNNKIYSLNIYNLAIYEGTELHDELDSKFPLGTLNDFDRDENVSEKSFLTPIQQKATDYFYNSIFRVGLNILKKEPKFIFRGQFSTF